MIEHLSKQDFPMARFEELQDEVRFDELLELAVDTCFVTPNRFYHKLAEKTADTESPSPDAEIVQQLGLWGLREAVEITHDPYTVVYREALKAVAPESWYVDAASIIREPEAFGGSRNPDIARKIEAFGATLIDEAFLCLGEDALSMAQQFGTGAVDEQIDALIWLTKRMKRIQEVGDTPVAQASNEQEYYLPIRLSPKAVGAFPDINVAPSCLGVSLLGAAFFAKAGARMLHAGIAKADSDWARQAAAESTMEAKDMAHSQDIVFPNAVTELLDSVFRQNMRSALEDHGYHTAIYARLNEKEWVEFDPNYNKVAGVVPQHSGQTIGEAWQSLTEFAALGPGLEYMYADHESAALPIYIRKMVARRLERIPDVETLDTWLEDAPNDLTLEQIADRTITPAFFASLEDGSSEEAQRESLWRLIKAQQHPMSELELNDGYFAEMAQRVVEKYVFPDAKDGDLRVSLERCKVDEHYRRRRAEDLRAAPLLAYVRMIGDIADAAINHHIVWSHQIVELGLPEYRIGAAVLSDFAAFCDDELGSRFWATYWPSHPAVTEHAAEAPAATARDLQVTSNLAQYLHGSILRYTKNNVIVRDILEQRTGNKVGLF